MTNELNRIFLDLYKNHSKISSKKNFNKFINQSLKRIGQLLNADRIYIFDYDWTDETSSNSFEWCQLNIEPQIEHLQKVPMSSIKLWVKKHQAGEAMIIPSVDDLENKDLKNILKAQGIKSLYAFPITMNNQCIGFYGVDFVQNEITLTPSTLKSLWEYNDIYLMYLDGLLKSNKIKRLELEVNSLKSSRRNFYNYMTHHLKTPLNILMGHMKIIENSIDPNYYKTMRKAAFDLNKLINTSIKLSKTNIYDKEKETQFFDFLELAEYFSSLSKYNIQLNANRNYIISHNRDYFYYFLFYLIDLFESLEISVDMIPSTYEKLSIHLAVKFDENIVDSSFLLSNKKTLSQSYKAFQWEIIKQLFKSIDAHFTIKRNNLTIHIQDILYKNKSDQGSIHGFIQYEESKLLLIDGIQMHKVILEIILKNHNLSIDHLYSSQLLDDLLEENQYNIILFSINELEAIKKVYQKNTLKNTYFIAIGDENIIHHNSFIHDQIYVPIEKIQTLKTLTKYLKPKKYFKIEDKDKYENLIKQYQEVKNDFVINEIESFAEKTLKYGKKYDNNLLRNYAHMLLGAIEDINIKEIKELIAQFDTFI